MKAALRLLVLTALLGWLPVLVAYGAVLLLVSAPTSLIFILVSAAYFGTLGAGAALAVKLDVYR